MEERTSCIIWNSLKSLGHLSIERWAIQWRQITPDVIGWWILAPTPYPDYQIDISYVKYFMSLMNFRWIPNKIGFNEYFHKRTARYSTFNTCALVQNVHSNQSTQAKPQYRDGTSLSTVLVSVFFWETHFHKKTLQNWVLGRCRPTLYFNLSRPSPIWHKQQFAC